jgi:hypothetical protein
MFPKTGNKLHLVRAQGLDDASFNFAIAAALKNELGQTHQAVKIVIRWTGASERTVKYWFAGTHGPTGDNLVNLVANSDAVFKLLLSRAGRTRALANIKAVDVQRFLTAALERLEDEE